MLSVSRGATTIWADMCGVEGRRTESHRYQTHHSRECHWWLVVVVFVIAICPEPIFLVVVRVARHALVGVDLLDMFHRRLHFDAGLAVGALCSTQSADRNLTSSLPSV